MKRLLTLLLLALSLTVHAQSDAPEYEAVLAKYIYMDIDRDDKWDCIDTSKGANPVTIITYRVRLMCYSYDMSDFVLNNHYRVAITDEVLYEMYEKIVDTYYRSYRTEVKRNVIQNSGVQMEIENNITETLQEDEVIVCTNVSFTLILQK